MTGTHLLVLHFRTISWGGSSCSCWFGVGGKKTKKTQKKPKTSALNVSFTDGLFLLGVKQNLDPQVEAEVPTLAVKGFITKND